MGIHKGSLERLEPVHPGMILAINAVGARLEFNRDEVLQLRKWCNEALLDPTLNPLSAESVVDRLGRSLPGPGPIPLPRDGDMP